MKVSPVLGCNIRKYSRSVCSMKVSAVSLELVQWEATAEGENGIFSLLIMDHNQSEDYRETWVLIETQLCVKHFF